MRPRASATGSWAATPQPMHKSAIVHAPRADATTPFAGVLHLSDTVASQFEPGTPPSRAKAKSMRELDVTDARPQNHIAPMAVHVSARASDGGSACARATAKPTASGSETARTSRTPSVV